jgi:hypothetical protein
MRNSQNINLASFQQSDNDFAHLSLTDLIAARDLFHLELMRRPNVVATAIGKYRIRIGDSWPNEKRQRREPAFAGSTTPKSGRIPGHAFWSSYLNGRMSGPSNRIPTGWSPRPFSCPMGLGFRCA